MKFTLEDFNNMRGNRVWFGPNDRTSEENRCYVAASWVGGVLDEGDPEPEWHGGVLDMVGILRNLLPPIVALQIYGSVEEITAKIDNVKKTIEIVRDLNDLKKDFPERKQAVSELENMAEEWERIRPRMGDAEKILAAGKWKYDPDTKKIRELSGGEKGRPGGFLARCCIAVYLDQYDGRKLNADVLQGIKKHLSEFFPEEYLDASPKGSIYWAVKYRGVGPKNRKGPKTPKL